MKSLWSTSAAVTVLAALGAGGSPAFAQTAPATQAAPAQTAPDNTNAIGLYRSLGYVEKGMHPKFNCVLMEAPLSAAPPQ